MNIFFSYIKKLLTKFDKLHIKSLMLMVLSIFLSYFTVGIIATFIIYPRINLNTKGQIIYDYTAVFIIILIFLVFYSFGSNMRIKYLKYIVNHLKDIENINYLENVKIKGNDEIATLAKSINIMLDRLKENYNYEKKIEKEKNELIVSVSHDIKTPLTSITGYLELIKK
jgi:signal transduction histidine kinase